MREGQPGKGRTNSCTTTRQTARLISAVQCEGIHPIEKSLKCLGFDLTITEDDIVVYDQYAGGGYGFMTEEKAEAIKIMAETEGLFLDPVYTSSAMACLVDLCRKGFFKREDVVVFLHTGGATGLFPYKAPLKAYGSGKALPWTIPPWSPNAEDA